MPYRSPDRRDHDRNRGFGRGPWFGSVWPYWPASYGLLGYPGFEDYPAWWDYDDSDDASVPQTLAPMGSQPEDYDAGPPYPDAQSASLPPWPSIYPSQNSPQPSQNSAQTVAAQEPAEPVTIVFNDGRKPEKIVNYVLTPTTLMVFDGRPSEIPVADLDLAATVKANREAGVPFNLPRGAQ